MGSEAEKWVECDETWYAWNPEEARLDERRVLRKRADRVEVEVAGYRVGVVLKRPGQSWPYGLHPTPAAAYEAADRALEEARHANADENRRLGLLHDQVRKARATDKRLGLGRAG